MGIIIGKYRTRIGLYRKDTVQNSVGEYITTRTLIKSVWAQFVDNSGTENFQASELTANLFATFNVRTLSLPTDFNYMYFVNYKGNYYDVSSIKEIEPTYKNITQIACVHKDNSP